MSDTAAVVSNKKAKLSPILSSEYCSLSISRHKVGKVKALAQVQL
jgi:hypothetical protein